MKVVIKMSLPVNYAITVSPKKKSDQILPKHPHQLACSPTKSHVGLILGLKALKNQANMWMQAKDWKQCLWGQYCWLNWNSSHFTVGLLSIVVGDKSLRFCQYLCDIMELFVSVDQKVRVYTFTQNVMLQHQQALLLLWILLTLPTIFNDDKMYTILSKSQWPLVFVCPFLWYNVLLSIW